MGIDLRVDETVATSHPEQIADLWYVRDVAGRVVGPLFKTQLDQWHANGQIDLAWRLRREDWSDWRSPVDVYPSLAERTINWGLIRRRLRRAWRLLRDQVNGYFANLMIQWSPSSPHLRRCIAHCHHQFSTHAPCNCCGEPTVGLHVADVVIGHDELRQNVYNIWSVGQRQVSRVFRWSLGVGAAISAVFLFTTWWSVFLVPITAAIAIAVPVVIARLTNWNLELRLGARLFKVPRPVTENEIERIRGDFIDPFLRRNEIAAGTNPSQGAFPVKRLKSLDQAAEVFVDQRELFLLAQTLASNGVLIWTNASDARAVLNAFALKSDYSLFKQRIEKVESTSISLVVAYASLVTHDEAFLPFLQQLLAERGINESGSSILQMLAAARHQLQLRGFARDLQQRRHGSMAITMEMVDRMDPFNFELVLGMIYETQGFRVTETPKTGDQGADVLLERAGERTVVQAKLYSKPVGNDCVQEVNAARDHYCCQVAKVITNNYFTPSARALAASCDVHLIDRDQLATMLADFNKCPKDYGRLVEVMRAVTMPACAKS